MADDVEARVIIVARYHDEFGAQAALKELKHRRKEAGLRILDAAVLKRDRHGKIKVTETGDMGGGKGSAVGVLTGAAIGVLTGGVGFLAVGGGAIGGLTAKLRDTGFDNEALKQVTEQLDVGSSMLIAVCEDLMVEQVVELIERDATDVIRHIVDAEHAQEFAELDAVAVDLGETTTR